MKNYFNVALTVMALFVIVGCNTYEKSITYISASEGKALIEKVSATVILDIRTSAEFERGHIKNALNIDYYEPSFEFELKKLAKDSTYFVYCRSGNRTRRSEDIFERLAFKQVFILEKGLREWIRSGYPIEQ